MTDRKGKKCNTNMSSITHDIHSIGHSVNSSIKDSFGNSDVKGYAKLNYIYPDTTKSWSSDIDREHHSDCDNLKRESEARERRKDMDYRPLNRVLIKSY